MKCSNCTREAVPDRSLCQSCNESHGRYWRKQQARRKEASDIARDRRKQAALERIDKILAMPVKSSLTPETLHMFVSKGEGNC